jgi:hypothetical protein
MRCDEPAPPHLDVLAKQFVFVTRLGQCLGYTLHASFVLLELGALASYLFATFARCSTRSRSMRSNSDLVPSCFCLFI